MYPTIGSKCTVPLNDSQMSLALTQSLATWYCIRHSNGSGRENSFAWPCYHCIVNFPLTARCSVWTRVFGRIFLWPACNWWQLAEHAECSAQGSVRFQIWWWSYEDCYFIQARYPIRCNQLSGNTGNTYGKVTMLQYITWNISYIPLSGIYRNFLFACYPLNHSSPTCWS